MRSLYVRSKELRTSVLENVILIVIDPVLGGRGSKMVVPFQMDYAYAEEYDNRVQYKNMRSTM
jgi:hypothetical protein